MMNHRENVKAVMTAATPTIIHGFQGLTSIRQPTTEHLLLFSLTGR
jgi:hypothetical protein